jgi:hypothetical protein
MSFPAAFLGTMHVYLFRVGIVFGVTVSLRLQVTSDYFGGRTRERAFADFVVGNLVLFLVVANFMG